MDEGELRWTPEGVGERLVAVFQQMMGVAIYSPRKLVLEPLLGRTITDGELLALTAECFGREHGLRVQLLTWASCRAKATGPPTGNREAASFGARCAEFGWDRTTADRRVGKAKRILAAWLNERQAWR
jgi:hypothetical protein